MHPTAHDLVLALLEPVHLLELTPCWWPQCGADAGEEAPALCPEAGPVACGLCHCPRWQRGTGVSASVLPVLWAHSTAVARSQQALQASTCIAGGSSCVAASGHAPSDKFMRIPLAALWLCYHWPHHPCKCWAGRPAPAGSAPAGLLQSGCRLPCKANWLLQNLRQAAVPPAKPSSSSSLVSAAAAAAASLQQHLPPLNPPAAA